MRTPAVVDVQIIRPVQLDLVWIRKLGRVQTGGHKVCEYGVTLLHRYNARAVSQVCFVCNDGSDKPEGWSGEAEAVVCKQCSYCMGQFGK